MLSRRKRIITSLVVFVLLFIILIPMFWMLSSALKPRNELFSIPPNIIPKKPIIDNFKIVLTTPEIIHYCFNSLFITITTATIAVFLAALAGYSLSRFSLPGKNGFLIFLLSSQMFPFTLLLIGIYFMMVKLSLLNSYISLILAFLALVLPVAIWLLKSYFDSIPRDFDDAAIIDGCTRFQVLYKIILPLSKPGLISVGTYITISIWNEYLFTFTLIQHSNYFTLPVGIDYLFRGEFSFVWDQLMAASFLMSLPTIIIFVIFQKGIVHGLSGTMLK